MRYLGKHPLRTVSTAGLAASLAYVYGPELMADSKDITTESVFFATEQTLEAPATLGIKNIDVSLAGMAIGIVEGSFDESSASQTSAASNRKITMGAPLSAFVIAESSFTCAHNEADNTLNCPVPDDALTIYVGIDTTGETLVQKWDSGSSETEEEAKQTYITGLNFASDAGGTSPIGAAVGDYFGGSISDQVDQLDTELMNAAANSGQVHWIDSCSGKVIESDEVIRGLEKNLEAILGIGVLAINPETRITATITGGKDNVIDITKSNFPQYNTLKKRIEESEFDITPASVPCSIPNGGISMNPYLQRPSLEQESATAGGAK